MRKNDRPGKPSAKPLDRQKFSSMFVWHEQNSQKQAEADSSRKYNLQAFL
jgi:hypothetical protein